MIIHMMHDTKLSSIDLNLLVVLRALLKERHVTRAARELGLSQSATSHALARLRNLYADPLLLRSGRGLELTPRAREILPLVERGLLELEGSVRAREPFDPRRARLTLRMVAADYGQAVLFGPLLSLVRAEAPGIDLQVTGESNALEQLDAGSSDLALLPKAQLPRVFSERRLFGDGFTCMLRTGHPALRRKRLTLEHYLELGHLLVAPSGTPGSFVDTELSRRGLSRRVVLHVSSFLVAPLVVAETDLISTGPERLLQRMSERFPIVLLPTPFKMARFDLCLVWHSRRDHDPAHTWMREAIVRVSRDL
jgi:DNA-binding transcriptional LysR family regulator